MKSLSLLFLALCSLSFNAQAPTDQIETKQGPLIIQPVMHAAMILTWNKVTIFVDPSMNRPEFAKATAPDIVLITDIHPDHLDTTMLASFNSSKAHFIVPAAVAEKMPARYKARTTIVANGQEVKQNGIQIKAIAMYNLPESPESMHTKGRGNGYILDMGGKHIYISGDTEDIPEMRNLKNIDVAFVCMNLPYTMTVQQAADAVHAFKPHIVYPYHYRGKDGLADINEFKKLVNASDPTIDVRVRDWYPQ